MTESTDRVLSFTRFLKASPEQVWKAWSNPRHIEQWWAPKPVITEVTAFDFKPGGAFNSTMTLPDGTVMPGEGSFLEVVPMSRIAFTDMFTAGWQPTESGFFAGVFDLSAEGSGTRYHVRALHKTPESAKEHADMGFHDGWGTVADQIDAFAMSL